MITEARPQRGSANSESVAKQLSEMLIEDNFCGMYVGLALEACSRLPPDVATQVVNDLTAIRQQVCQQNHAVDIYFTTVER